MPIKKRTLATGRQVYDVRVSVRGKRHTRMGLRTLAAAQKWERDMLDWRDGFAHSYTVEQLAWFWIEDAMLRLAESTIADYRVQLKERILPALGHLKSHEVRPGQVQALINKSAARPRTAQKTAVVLKALFKAAVLWGLIDASPAAYVRAPGQRKQEMVFLTQAQARALLAASEGDMRLYVRLGISTGMRPGELRALRWADIQGRKILVRRSKTAAGIRTVTISRDLARWLKPQRGEGYLFQLDGEPWTAYNLRWRFLKTVEQANLALAEEEQISGATPHSLRHTCAAWLMSEGVNVKYVQQQLGHTEPTFTLREYGHLVPGKAEEIADEFERGTNWPHEQGEDGGNVIEFPQ